AYPVGPDCTLQLASCSVGSPTWYIGSDGVALASHPCHLVSTCRRTILPLDRRRYRRSRAPRTVHPRTNGVSTEARRPLDRHVSPVRDHMDAVHAAPSSGPDTGIRAHR